MDTSKMLPWDLRDIIHTIPLDADPPYPGAVVVYDKVANRDFWEAPHMGMKWWKSFLPPFEDTEEEYAKWVPRDNRQDE